MKTLKKVLCTILTGILLVSTLLFGAACQNPFRGDLTAEQMQANAIGSFDIKIVKGTDTYLATVKSYAGIIDELSDFPKFIRSHYVAEDRQRRLLADGYTGQTRFWIDDMYDKHGRVRVDERNPDKMLRNVPCNQIVLMTGLKYDQARKRWGDTKIYDGNEIEIITDGIYRSLHCQEKGRGRKPLSGCRAHI